MPPKRKAIQAQANGPAAAAEAPVPAKRPKTAAKAPVPAKKQTKAAEAPIPAKKQKKAAESPVPAKKPKTAAQVKKKIPVARTVKKTLKPKPLVLECRKRHQRGSGFPLTLGQGDIGQLGHGEDILERQRPARIQMIDEAVADVCAGGMHTVLLLDSGNVLTFGCNDEGALGRSTDDGDGESLEFVPGKVTIPGNIIQISAGDSHTAALTGDGSVYVWGNFRDSSGAFGLTSEKQPQKRPIRILPSVRIAKIASGTEHLALLSTEGRIYTCGCAEQGQLGRVAECFTDRGGRKGLGLLLTPHQVNVAKVTGTEVFFDDIWAGSYSTFARATRSGEIYACGLNNYNQLGFSDPKVFYNLEIVPGFADKNWQQISPGMHHTLFLDDNGTVQALGRKDYGRLGLGENCQDATEPTPIPTLNGTKCVDVSCSLNVSYAVTENGNLFAWGMGTTGQLGRGKDEDDAWAPNQMTGQQLENGKVLAVSCGGQHTVILARDKN